MRSNSDAVQFLPNYLFLLKNPSLALGMVPALTKHTATPAPLCCIAAWTALYPSSAQLARSLLRTALTTCRTTIFCGPIFGELFAGWIFRGGRARRGPVIENDYHYFHVIGYNAVRAGSTLPGASRAGHRAA